MIDRRQFLSAAAFSGAGLAAPAVLRAAPVGSEDIRILGDILRTIHPGLHRYLSPARFEAGLVRLGQDWSAAPALDARYLALSRFLAAIRCGHSYANFFNQKRAVKAALFDRPTRLPFGFRWIGGEMVVLADHSGTARLPPGSVVRAVGGVPAARLLASLLPYTRVDGTNPGKQRALLSVSGAEEIEFFDVFHGLTYGVPPGGVHRLDVRLPGANRTSRIDLPALTLAQRQAFKPAADTRGDQPVWDWAIGADGIALLTMPNWALYDSKWDWQAWLDDRLGSLGGARGLIVDLRENEGGIDCGDRILARLADRAIARPRADRLVRYRQTPAALNPYLDTWDDSFRDWGDQAVPFNDRFLRLKRWEDDATITPAGPRVTVPMAVLIGPQNSSATFQFASLAKATGLGSLIGGTTGGNRRGINGGAFFFARLPESGIEFDVPLIGYYPQSRQPDAGIEPDIPIENSPADIAAGRDRVLDRAKAYLLHS